MIQLSVFRGTLRREAVLAITDATLNHLSALRSKSLLRLEAAGAYSLHEVVRGFSAEKGAAQNLILPAQQAHATYFLTQLIAQDGAAMRDEANNVRAAWRYAHHPPNFTLLKDSASPFAKMIEVVGLLSEIALQMETSLAQILPLPSSAERDELIANLYLIQVSFSTTLQGIELLHKALTLTRDSALQCKIYGDLGGAYAELNRHDEAVAYLERQAEAANKSGDPALMIDALVEQGIYRSIHFRGDYLIGIEQLEEALNIAQQHDVLNIDRTYIRQKLAVIYNRHRDFTRSLEILAAILEEDNLSSQYDRVDVQLDYALTATFAGLHKQAISFNERSLALAREIEDEVGVALLHANLTLAQRRAGNVKAALQHGRIAVRQLTELNETRMLGQAQTRLGHVLLALAHWQAACEIYRAALEIWEPADHPNQYEARVGLALALVELGETDAAIMQIEPVVQFVTLAGLARVVEPDLLLLNGVVVLQKLGRTQEAVALYQVGQAWIEMVVGRNDSAEIRTAFLNNQAVCKLAALKDF